MTRQQWWDVVVYPVLLVAGGGLVVAAVGLWGLLGPVGVVLLGAGLAAR